MLSYAQNFEDVWLARLFDGKRDGFYIDIGASHPESLSVTKHCYDLGWHGINIEPLPGPFALLQAARPRDLNLQVAIAETGATKTFFHVPGNEPLSTLDPSQARALKEQGHPSDPITVETLPLSEVVARHVDRIVDFLKVDVEGGEMAVLRSVDWRQFRPRVLVIEAIVPGSAFPGWDVRHFPMNCPWEPILLDAGYHLGLFDGLNRYYVRDEDHHLLPRFTLPLGHWDRIESPAALILSLRQQIQSQFDLGFIGRIRQLLGYTKRRAQFVLFNALRAWVEAGSSRPPLRKADRAHLDFHADPATPGPVPPSPIDGLPAERLLFHTADTRFGDPGIESVHLDERHGIAVVHPPRSAEELSELYRTRYNDPNAPTVAAAPAGSFQGFDRRPWWVRALHRLPTERLLGRWVDLSVDPTLGELKRTLAESGVALDEPLRVLDVGCFDGALMDDIRRRMPWQVEGMESNASAAARAAAKGHRIWVSAVEDALDTIPVGEQYDVIFLGQSIEHVLDPVLVIRKLRHLLSPGGHLVLSTPNLDSSQVAWFGPTWAHWHAPYHRHIFSAQGLQAVVRQAGLTPERVLSFSNAYWSALSLGLSRLGTGAFISHNHVFDAATTTASRRIQFWQKVLWDRRGQGDYLFIAAKEGGDE